MDDIEDTNYKFNSQDIEKIWYIFFCLADSTFSSVDVSYGKKGPYMLSGETMMSICKTLETIDFCCHRDAYSDAYTLLRKYRDDLMQYLFVLNLIQNKHGLTDEEAEKFNINSESMMKMIELDVSILVSGERKTAVMGQLCSVNGIMQKMMMNYYYTRRLQPEGKIDSIVRTIEAGETQKWKCYYVVNNTDEELFFEYIKVGQINRISLNLHKS